MPKPPNILWICTDQQRADTLGCYGNTWVRTPHLDELAEQGIRFEHAYCQNPVCTPSRASFLTGRYPRTTRCRQNGQAIPAEEQLVTKLLADAGYACGLAGKLHISPCHPSVCQQGERRIDDGYQVFHWSHHAAADWPGNAYSQWLHDRGQTFQTQTHPGSTYVRRGMPVKHHQTTWCAERAIEFIEQNADADQPWLFSVNFFDPHHPFDPPPSLLERYEQQLDELPLPVVGAGDPEDKPMFQQIDHDGAYGRPGSDHFPASRMSLSDHRLVRAAYWAMCDLIDQQVGRMLEALGRTGQRENTLVIFMSDHGEMLGDHGLYLKGPYFYEQAIRVPLIISQPGRVLTGQSDAAWVELVDLAPTLLEAAGLTPHIGMQGKSLWSGLTGQATQDHPREDIYCEYYNAMPWHREPQAHATMLRDERYKLVAVHGLQLGELYDLQQDPDEQHNLWQEPSAQSIKTRMLQRLCDRMAWTADPLPMRQAKW